MKLLLIAPSLAVLAIGEFAANQNSINMILAVAGVVASIIAFQKWVDGRIEHKLKTHTASIKMEITLLRLELGLRRRKPREGEDPSGNPETDR